MDYNKLMSYVSKNNFEKVFQILMVGIPEEEEELREELSIVEGKYNSFKKKERLGLLSNSDLNTERSNVALSTVELINSVKKKLA